MGKKQVRVIAVPKQATAALLVLVSGAMAALIFYLSGKTYSSGTEQVRQMLLDLMQREHSLTRDVLLATIMPAIANILFFVPWGFLMFVALDRPSQPRSRTYVFTVIAGTIFAMAMSIWQNFLPTRVTGLLDTISHAVGVFFGAVAGHVRKRLRVQFDY